MKAASFVCLSVCFFLGLVRLCSVCGRPAQMNGGVSACAAPPLASSLCFPPLSLSSSPSIALLSFSPSCRSSASFSAHLLLPHIGSSQLRQLGMICTSVISRASRWWWTVRQSAQKIHTMVTHLNSHSLRTHLPSSLCPLPPPTPPSSKPMLFGRSRLALASSNICNNSTSYRFRLLAISNLFQGHINLSSPRPQHAPAVASPAPARPYHRTPLPRITQMYLSRPSSLSLSLFTTSPRPNPFPYLAQHISGTGESGQHGPSYYYA